MADDVVMPDSADDTPVVGDSVESTQAIPNDDAEQPAGESADVGQGNAVLNKRIADTDTKLKEMQRELTRLSLEKARAEGEISALRNNGKKGDEQDRDWLEDEGLKDSFNSKFNDDPMAAVAQLLKQQRVEFAQLLKQRDDYLEGRARELAQEAADPTRQQLKGVIEELKAEQPWFAALDGKAQIEVAKLKLGAAGAATATPASTKVKPPAAGPAGTGQRIAATPKGDERKKAAQEIADRYFGKASSVDEQLYPFGKE